MLRTKKWTMSLALLGGMVALMTSSVQAGLIPNKVTVLPDGGNYRWTYNVVVTSDVYVKTGDYFTIYDFAGAINGSALAPTDWTLSVANVGLTPTKTNPADDPKIPNYTWTYTGASMLPGSLGLGNFSLLTPYDQSAESDFTSKTHRQDNNILENTITSTTVPVASGGTAQTPEPGTLALFAAGLPLVGLLRRRRKA